MTWSICIYVMFIEYIRAILGCNSLNIPESSAWWVFTAAVTLTYTLINGATSTDDGVSSESTDAPADRYMDVWYIPGVITVVRQRLSTTCVAEELPSLLDASLTTSPRRA